MGSDSRARWLSSTLGEHVDLLAGFAFKSTQFINDADGIRLLRGDNIAPGRLRWNGARRWRATDRDTFAQYELARGDVVIAMDRPWIEAGLKFSVVRPEDLPSLLVQRVARLRASELLDQRFLASVIQAPDFTSYVHAMQTGTAVPHISAKQIAGYPVRLPPLREQRRISAVLGTLDDKIDSSRRLESLLERLVDADFQARFVHRLEGEKHQGVQGGEGRGGCLSDLAEVVRATVRPTATPDQLFAHFSIPAFDAGNGPDLVRGSEVLSGKSRLPDADCVLLSKLNPATKRVWWPRSTKVGTPVCSSEFLVLAPRPGIPNTYLYAAVSADDRFYADLLERVSGTTGSRQRVKPSDAMACRVTAPPSSTLQAWDRYARPLYDHAHQLPAESRTLQAIRDALLPKLVSGQIRVPDTDDPEEVIGPAAEELVA